MHFASYDGSLDLVKLLVKAGSDLNLKDEDGTTALDDAISGGNKECAFYLESVGTSCD